MATQEERNEEWRIEAIETRRAHIRNTRCVCGDDLPGTCPGPRNCPNNQPDAPEPREVKAGAVIVFTYVEFGDGTLDYAEWTEDGEKHHGPGDSCGADPVIPDAIRKALAEKIFKSDTKGA